MSAPPRSLNETPPFLEKIEKNKIRLFLHKYKLWKEDYENVRMEKYLGEQALTTLLTSEIDLSDDDKVKEYLNNRLEQFIA